MVDTTRFLHPVERAGIDELRHLQTKRVNQTLRHVYDHSPVYRAKFEGHQVHPDRFQSLDDLPAFPFTTKADFRGAYPFGMCCVPMDRVARVHASSGTTGQPTVVCYTQEDLNTWADLCARSIHAAGGRAGDKVHVAYGYGLFTGGLGAHYGAERLGCTVIPVSGGQTERQVRLIRDFDPDIIMVTPSYMLNLCDEVSRQGLDPDSLRLRVGILGAEPWTEAMRAEIELRMAMDAVDIYGLSEAMGPGVAQEYVETKDGPTIWEDHFYPEIVHPDTGDPVPDGEPGELVLTSLTKQALPVIRYRTRDLTRLRPGTARHMRRIERITGRSDDMLIVRGVNLFPSQIEELVLGVDGLSPHHLIEVDRNGSMDLLFVRVEPASGDATLNENLARTLGDRIRSVVGISARVEVVPPGTLPRSEGKACRVVDRRRR